MILNSDRVTSATNSSYNKNRFIDAGANINMSKASLGMPITGDAIQNSDYSFMFMCGASQCGDDDITGV